MACSDYFVEPDRNWISFKQGTKTGTLTVCPLGVLKVRPSGTSARGERSFATHTPIVISSPCLKESFVTLAWSSDYSLRPNLLGGGVSTPIGDRLADILNFFAIAGRG